MISLIVPHGAIAWGQGNCLSKSCAPLAPVTLEVQGHTQANPELRDNLTETKRFPSGGFTLLAKRPRAIRGETGPETGHVGQVALTLRVRGIECDCLCQESRCRCQCFPLLIQVWIRF